MTYLICSISIASNLRKKRILAAQIIGIITAFVRGRTNRPGTRQGYYLYGKKLWRE